MEHWRGAVEGPLNPPRVGDFESPLNPPILGDFEVQKSLDVRQIIGLAAQNVAVKTVRKSPIYVACRGHSKSPIYGGFRGLSSV